MKTLKAVNRIILHKDQEKAMPGLYERLSITERQTRNKKKLIKAAYLERL